VWFDYVPERELKLKNDNIAESFDILYQYQLREV